MTTQQGTRAKFASCTTLSASCCGVSAAKMRRWHFYNRLRALEATEAAVEHYRKLVTTDRMAYAPQLATNLSNLGIWQWERGNVAGGFGPTLEAVELRREFVRANAAPWSAALADSLTNLGICFGLLERYEEALGVTEEATSIRRKLVRSNPLS